MNHSKMIRVGLLFSLAALMLMIIAADGLHPNALGQQLILKQVLQAISY